MAGLSRWLRRQRAQWLVNLKLIDYTAAARQGSAVPTSEPDFPFYLISDALLCGRPSVVMKTNKPPFHLFDDCFNPRDKRGMVKRLLRDMPTGKAERRFSKAMSLSVYWLENYWHWMYEGLPKVLLAEEAGFDGIYIVHNLSFVKESLALIGIPENRLAFHIDGPTQVDQLWMAPRFDGESLFERQALLNCLRDRLLTGARQQLGTDFDRNPGPHRCYASRNRGSLSRSLINEPEVRVLLEQHGFSQFDSEGHSLAQQIAYYAHCEAIAGPHGAAFTNSLFMPPGSTVIELFSPLYIWPVSLPANRLLGHRFHTLVPRLQDPGNPYPHGLGVEANLRLLQATLESCFSRKD